VIDHISAYLVLRILYCSKTTSYL